MTVKDIDLAIELNGLNETKKRLADTVNKLERERLDRMFDIAKLTAEVISIKTVASILGDDKIKKAIEAIEKHNGR